jgi:AcrR family transcriptional regulator
MPQRPAPADSALGLRERKKLRTRSAIQEHALRLFREQGYERTTIEQIAGAADVSPSTFFRYFPTKEDVVLFDAFDPLLEASFRRQPAELSPIVALRAAMHEVFDGLSPATAEEQRERARLAAQVPELQAAWLGEILRTASMLQRLLAERAHRDPADPRVRVYAGAVLGALMAALIPTLEDPDRDFIPDVDAALDFLEDGLTL